MVTCFGVEGYLTAIYNDQAYGEMGYFQTALANQKLKCTSSKTKWLILHQ